MLVSCAECVYRGEDAQCRINPPYASKDAKGNAVWPTVTMADSCGCGDDGYEYEEEDEEEVAPQGEGEPFVEAPVE